MHGRVKANVNASAVVVQGKLEGSIQASDRVDLKQSAVVTGDIATQRISIDDGAYFKGRVNIQKEIAQGGSGACGRLLNELALPLAERLNLPDQRCRGLEEVC